MPVRYGREGTYGLDGNGQDPYMDEGYVGITEGGDQGGDQFKLLFGGSEGYTPPGDVASIGYGAPEDYE